MSPWFFNVYMDGVVREVNARVLRNWQELLSGNGGRFEINQLLFADGTALVADSEEKLCRQVSEFGRVCERIKLRRLRVTVHPSRCIKLINKLRFKLFFADVHPVRSRLRVLNSGQCIFGSPARHKTPH